VTLRVSLLQAELHWQDPAANRARFDERLREVAPGSADVVILPEMFTTGFSMDSATLAEPVAGPTAQWLQAWSRRLDAAVTGSVMTREGDRCVNRLWFATPEGALHRYDKRHLFRMAGEHEHFAAGRETLVVQFRGWRIAPLVCYDLRFPVWSRRRDGFDYDLLVYVANWPARRAYAWRQLLIARAIENQSYVVGVNRIGTDGNGIAHDGDSAAHDFLGQPIATLGGAAATTTVSLELDALREFRERFPAHLDADRFTLE
jgi:predicted amidohydrolase